MLETALVTAQQKQNKANSVHTHRRMYLRHLYLFIYLFFIFTFFVQKIRWQAKARALAPTGMVADSNEHGSDNTDMAIWALTSMNMVVTTRTWPYGRYHGVCHNLLGHRFICQQEQAGHGPKRHSTSHCWCHENAHIGDSEDSRPGAPGTSKNILSSYSDGEDPETIWSSVPQAGCSNQK